MLASVLADFGLTHTASSLVARGNAGGMSGAAIWTLYDADVPLCLRRWPTEHPTADHLLWIHAHLMAAGKAGCPFIPVPRLAPSGVSFVARDGHLWEVTPWLPGTADFHDDPRPERLEAICRALAQLHRAFARHTPPVVASSPGLTQRLAELRRLDERTLATWRRLVGQMAAGALREACRLVIEAIPARREGALRAVAAVADLRVPLQPCIRDIWHDHVLLTGDQVTGIVDFGAMRVESRSADLARLFGSLLRDDHASWNRAVAVYAESFPLDPQERLMLSAFDQANLVLSGANWVRWLAVEQRQFPTWEPVKRRLAEIGLRLAFPQPGGTE